MAERNEKGKRPIVGVGILIFNSKGEILLGERFSKIGNGTMVIPGGKLDGKETFIEAAIREVREETSLSGDDIKFGKYISVSYERVYDLEGLTVGIEAFSDVVPKEIASEGIGNWRWFSLDKLPENLFLPSARIIANHKKGVVRDIGENFILTRQLGD